jgi:murein DD-endopeptidase MepM/ murein hydrolase activator NlpD
VVLVLFIINSGAYIVPPKPGISGAIESPYIGVEKKIVKVLDKDNREINIEIEEISNDRLPIKVSYKVSVKAKKGTLTNITFENICRVTKDGPPPTCTAPTPNETPDLISPVEDFVFEYEKDYKSPDHQDTFVADIFTVTADAPEQKGAVAATSAVVKIGEPPEECPHEWPIDSGYITQGAYTPSNYSHHSMEAIDFGANLRPTFAGHSGIVTKAEFNSCIGNYIEIQSTCEGRSFVSQYAHLEGLGVKTGQQVVMGQTIGLSGNTGSCTTGPHLHYRFKYVPSGKAALIQVVVVFLYK